MSPQIDAALIWDDKENQGERLGTQGLAELGHVTLTHSIHICNYRASSAITTTFNAEFASHVFPFPY
jgi:hypothetical protein